MIDSYRDYRIKKVTENYIELDHTKNRVLNFDIASFHSLGVFLIMQIFSYNKQDIVEYIITFSVLIITIILQYVKKYICYKTIVFDRVKGKILLKRNVPFLNKTFIFSKCDITSEKKVLRGDEGVHRYYSAYIKYKYIDPKYLLCNHSIRSENFQNFIVGYMKSDKAVLNSLQLYDRDEDKELYKPFHL